MDIKYIYIQNHKMTEPIHIPNIENYTQEIICGVLILTPKNVFITEEELQKTILTNSSILKCEIKNNEDIIPTITSYRGVLIDIWDSMPTQKILQTTTFNFKLKNENKNGYNWCNRINMSFQNKDANGTFKEILNMIKVNNYNIKISIKLETGRVIQFKI